MSFIKKTARWINLCLLFLCVGWVSQVVDSLATAQCDKGIVESSTRQTVILIEDTHTVVKDSSLLTGEVVATVHLKIGTLVFDKGTIRGRYEVEVDMSTLPVLVRKIASSKDEVGEVILPFEASIGEMMAKGAELKGEGIREDNKEKRKIHCSIKPNSENPLKGSIRLTIDSGKRIMEFDSQYALVDIDQVKSLALLAE